MEDFETFTARFILRGQWKSTRAFDGKNDDPRKHSRFACFLIFFLPPIVFIALLILGLCGLINIGGASEGLLASMGVLASALIASFALLASWRSGFPVLPDDTSDRKILDLKGNKWLVDSSSTHMLAGAYSAICSSIVAAELACFESIQPHGMTVIAYSLAIALASHVAASLLIALPGLYAAYTELNDVQTALDGQQSLKMKEEDKL